MWDIEAIIEQHNNYALGTMMNTLRTEVVQSPQPKNWALSVLASKLKTGPPVLSELLGAFTGVEEMCGFLELIMRYLQGHEVEILSERGNVRLYRFCELWSKRYFPLLPYSHDQSVGDFVGSMPIGLLGMSYTAYHELAMRPGYILLLSLLVYPYEGDERDEEDDRVPFDPAAKPVGKYKPSSADVRWLTDLVGNLAVNGEWVAPMGFAVVKVSNNNIELRDAKNTPEVKETIARTLLVAEKAGIEVKFKRTGRTSQEKINGARVALVDAVRQMVGDGLVKLMPPSGWTRDHLHRMTDGTLYDGVGAFADWVFGDTGCVILDANYENCSYVGGMGDPYFRWSKYNVDKLTKQWSQVRQTREKIDNIVEFIEGDPGARFSELLELLCSQKPKRSKKELGLEDRMFYGVGLEQVDFDDDEESEDE